MNNERLVVLYSSIYPEIYKVCTKTTFNKIFNEEIKKISDRDYTLDDLVTEFNESATAQDEGIRAEIMEVE